MTSVAPEVFERLRSLDVSRVGDRIESLLSHYPCFDRSRPHMTKRSGIARRLPIAACATIPQCRRQLQCVDSSVCRMTALLNKVNEGNYTRILDQIIVCGGDAPSASCAALLRKCYEQDFFTHVYIRLLSDVMRTVTDGSERTALDAALSAFVTDTMELVDASIDPLPIGSQLTPYDEVCIRLKAKRLSLGRARTSLGLIDAGLVPTRDREQFYQAGVRAITRHCIDPGYEDDRVDVAIEYIREFMKSAGDRTEGRMGELSRVLTDHVDRHASLMCRFKLQGVIALPRPVTTSQSPPPRSRPAEAEELWRTTTRLRQHLRLPSSRPRDLRPGCSRAPG